MAWQRNRLRVEIILTTKQAISITFAATVTHDMFYFNLKSSVAFILNYGHMSISCKDTRTQSGQCLLSEHAFGVETKGIIELLMCAKQDFHVPLPPTSDECSRVDIAGRV